MAGWENWQEVIELIGEENARKLISKYGGTGLYIPSRDRSSIERQIKEMLKTKSYREVARIMKLSLSTIYRISCRPDE